MKHIVLILILLWKVVSAADFDRAVVDISKFKDQARAAMEPFGQRPMDIIFQDAAFGSLVDSKNLVDGAYLMALGKVTDVNTQLGKFRLAYRLHLASGRTDLVFVKYVESGRAIILPRAFYVVFDIDIPKAVMEEMTIRLGKILGGYGTLTLYDRLKRLSIELTEPTVEVFNQLRELFSRSLGDKIHFAYTYERYKTPRALGAIQVLTYDEFVDLDKRRDVVPKLLKEGYTFTTMRSRIPSSLKRSWWLKGSCGVLFSEKSSN